MAEIKTVNGVEVVRLPMVCIHQKDEKDERPKQAEELYQKALKLCGAKSDDHFIEQVIFDLWHYYDIKIEFAVDMWWGVYGKIYDYDKGEPTKRPVKWRISCECDRLKHGLATIFIWVYENRPDDYGYKDE